MIRITIQDLQNKSPRCVKDCGRFHVDGCANNCKLRYRYVFVCPHCKRISAFYGLNCPFHCGGCQKAIPDMYNMASDDLINTRKAYHVTS